MSTSDSDDRRGRLIRALDAELAREPADDATERSDAVESARVSWLDQFRAGVRPFQQADADAPLLDDLDLELWLLLEKEKTFRSGPAAGSAPAAAFRARTAEGAVVQVRSGPDDGTWEVRLRKASPGTYRVDLAWESGDRASAQIVVVEGNPDGVAVPGPAEPPARVRVTRLDG
jgi:hypothetical protein